MIPPPELPEPPDPPELPNPPEATDLPPEPGSASGAAPDIVLLGMRGAGKSTVGRGLAARLGRRFLDLDVAALAAFPEATVQAVWDAHGEQAWREAELAALERALTEASPPLVIALGGGTPMIPRAHARLGAARQAGAAWLVYLTAPAATLAARLRAGPSDRPSLTGARAADEEVAFVLATREATYRALADIVVSTADGSTEAAVEAIVRRLPNERP